jgi:hypothetical protein
MSWFSTRFAARRGRIQVKSKGAMEVWHILGPKIDTGVPQSSNQHQALVNVPIYG